MGESPRIGVAERVSLALVFMGPASLWVWAARLYGVKVVAASVIDDALLAQAERDARISGRKLALGIAAAVPCMALILLWSPVEVSLVHPLIDQWFDSIAGAALSFGVSRSSAGDIASAAMYAFIVVLGLLNAFIIGGVPLYLFRSSTCAAATAASVALAHQAQPLEPGRLAAYPRVAFVLERVLDRRERQA